MILELKNVSKSFGGLKAVDDVSFAVKTGEVLSVIGPNGAGKSTLFNMIAGTFPPTAGSITYLNKEIAGEKAYKIFRQGISRTFQTHALFEKLTVKENLLTSQISRTRAGLWNALYTNARTREERQMMEETSMRTADFVGLKNAENKLAKNLTLEDRSRLSIGLALAAKPKLLLLDEPMAGLNAEEINKLLELILVIRSQGTTICMVEHKMSAVMKISDRIVVLNFGKLLAQGLPDEIVRNKEVMKAYLGEDYVAQHQ